MWSCVRANPWKAAGLGIAFAACVGGFGLGIHLLCEPHMCRHLWVLLENSPKSEAIILMGSAIGMVICLRTAVIASRTVRERMEVLESDVATLKRETKALSSKHVSQQQRIVKLQAENETDRNLQKLQSEVQAHKEEVGQLKSSQQSQDAIKDMIQKAVKEQLKEHAAELEITKLNLQAALATNRDLTNQYNAAQDNNTRLNRNLHRRMRGRLLQVTASKVCNSACQYCVQKWLLKCPTVYRLPSSLQ